LARKGLSVIAAFLLSQFPNFRWDLERRVTPLEIAADRNRQWSWSKHKSADRDRGGDHGSARRIAIGRQRDMVAEHQGGRRQGEVITGYRFRG
jgi:hypothetical protein